MIHKYMNYAWIIMIASIMMTGSAEAKRYDDDDFVGEIDCVIYDAKINGWHIDRIDAEGFLTEIRD